MVVTKKKYTKHNKHTTRSKSLNKVRSRQSGGNNKRPRYVNAYYVAKDGKKYANVLSNDKILLKNTIDVETYKNTPYIYLNSDKVLTLPNIELLQNGTYTLKFSIAIMPTPFQNSYIQCLEIKSLEYTRTGVVFHKTSTKEDITDYKDKLIKQLQTLLYSNKQQEQKQEVHTFLLKIDVLIKQPEIKGKITQYTIAETLVFKISLNDTLTIMAPTPPTKLVRNVAVFN